MITLDTACKLVDKLSGDNKIELFNHFVEVFDLKKQDELECFARDCGFMIAKNLVLLDDKKNEFECGNCGHSKEHHHLDYVDNNGMYYFMSIMSLSSEDG